MLEGSEGRKEKKIAPIKQSERKTVNAGKTLTKLEILDNTRVWKLASRTNTYLRDEVSILPGKAMEQANVWPSAAPTTWAMRRRQALQVQDDR